MTSTAEATVAKRDHRQEVTDLIVKMLEEGVAPWQKPWQSSGVPMNPTTGREYRGGNAVHLMAMGLARGYDDPRWMTYKQATENGWQVRKGEKGTHIEFWEAKTTSSEKSSGVDSTGDREHHEETGRRRLIHRVYTVFNAKQIEGIPAYERRSELTSKSHRVASAFWSTPARESPTISVIVPFTIAAQIAFISLRKRPSAMRPATTVPLSTSFPTGRDIRHV